MLASKIKFKILLEEEYAFKFITKMYFSQDQVELSEKAKEMYEKMLSFGKESFQKIQETQDTSKFKENIDPINAKKYIVWILEGFSQEITNNFENAPLAEENFLEEWKKMDTIVEDIRKLFYKE